jgi:non-ribosomal peptide synthase protein (TIGR01720 family)
MHLNLGHSIAHGIGYGLLRYLRNGAEIDAPKAQLCFNYLGQLDQVSEQQAGLFCSGDVGHPAHGVGQRGSAVVDCRRGGRGVESELHRVVDGPALRASDFSP